MGMLPGLICTRLTQHCNGGYGMDTGSQGFFGNKYADLQAQKHIDLIGPEPAYGGVRSGQRTKASYTKVGPGGTSEEVGSPLEA